jgi:hypothetical protein
LISQQQKPCRFGKAADSRGKATGGAMAAGASVNSADIAGRF